MNEKKKKWLSAGITAAVLFAFFMLTHRLNGESTAYDWLVTLANAFTVPGVVLAGIGGLSWCASQGTFDLFSYGTSMLFGRFLPLGKKNVFHSGEKYYDYVERKRENRKAWLKEWLLIGVAMVAVALVLTLVSHLV